MNLVTIPSLHVKGRIVPSLPLTAQGRDCLILCRAAVPLHRRAIPLMRFDRDNLFTCLRLSQSYHLLQGQEASVLKDLPAEVGSYDCGEVGLAPAPTPKGNDILGRHRGAVNTQPDKCYGRIGACKSQHSGITWDNGYTKESHFFLVQLC